MKLRVILVAVLLVPVLGFGQDRPQVFTGATILTMNGEVIENGTLLVHEGRITAVGTDVRIPANAMTHDVSGKIIMPGLVDTHSHVGQVSGADSSGPIQPEVRALDSINVRHSSIQRAQAGGITTANVMPGSGQLLSGQTLYLKLKDGRTIEDLVIRDGDGELIGGIKMANGTNSRRKPPFPQTRAKSAALIREKYVEALEYREKMKKAEKKPDKKPARDLAMEALIEVIERERTVHHHTHRHDDIVTVLRLAKEFGFEVVLHHISEGWKVADEIAAAGAPTSIIMIDSPGGKLEAKDLSFETGAILEDAGVLVAYHTDDPITDSRLFLRSPALGVRAGLSREAALASVTTAGAKMLHLDHRVGSLEKGKDADFIILSGDPLSVYTKVLETWIEGEKVFDRDDPKDRLFAVGGWGASGDGLYSEALEMEGSR